MHGETYLVVVVAQCLPIVISGLTPLMIEAIFLEIEARQPFLSIHTSEVVVPRYCGLWRSVEVDPDESRGVNVDMDREKGILRLVESWNVLILGCLR